MTEKPADLSPAEAADYKGVSDKTIRRWIAAGVLPAQRVPTSKRLLIRRADLDAVNAVNQPVAVERAS